MKAEQFVNSLTCSGIWNFKEKILPFWLDLFKGKGKQKSRKKLTPFLQQNSKCWQCQIYLFLVFFSLESIGVYQNTLDWFKSGSSDTPCISD